MKGVKLKCTGFLILLGLLALSFLTCSDVSALKHEYIGINSTVYSFPPLVSNNGSYEFDWSSSSFSNYWSSDSGYLVLGVQGSAWPFSDDDYNHIKPKLSASEVRCTNFNSTPCDLNEINSEYHTISRNGVSGHKYYFGLGYNIRYIPTQVTVSQSNTNYLYPLIFGDRNQPAHNAFSGLMSCSYLSNGALCPGLWNTAEYVDSKVLPYPYSSSGFYLKSKATNPNNGILYSNTFSLRDLWDYSSNKFSYLSVPLHTDDGYFWDSSNFSRDRQIEFKGVFEFDGDFSWNPDLDGDAFFGIEFTARSKHSTSVITGEFDCTANLITIPGATQLEYSCPYTLQDDYIAFLPRLVLRGDSENNDSDDDYKYLFQTNDEWRFASTFLVTDNDETPGYSFNTTITGGGEIPGDAANEIPDDDGMWQMDAATLDNLIDNFFPNLMGMFNFNLFNPFISIFGLFTSGEDCVNVPTFANMIHSDNPQVCPWFPGWVRNITTPVMSIVSTMLLFGFMLRWVRSSSSDFSPDSSGGKP